jgi:hypothetical protein
VEISPKLCEAPYATTVVTFIIPAIDIYALCLRPRHTKLKVLEESWPEGIKPTQRRKQV